MKKILLLIAVATAATLMSSCRSSRPACPAYNMVSSAVNVLHF